MYENLCFQYLWVYFLFLADFWGCSRSGTSQVKAGRGGEEEDEDSVFMSKWKALFSKKSPLAVGTATDPFADDLERRHTVVWKQNRRGHRRRYQLRRLVMSQTLLQPQKSSKDKKYHQYWKQ